MKNFAKFALAGLLLATSFAAPAQARAIVNLRVGPAPFLGPAYDPPDYPACNPHSYFYNPAECGPTYFEPSYGPDFFLSARGTRSFHGGGFHGGGFHGAPGSVHARR